MLVLPAIVYFVRGSRYGCATCERFDRAVAGIADFADAEELIDDENPRELRHRVPGLGAFYRAAETLLGPTRRVRNNTVRVYTIPTSTPEKAAKS